MCGVRQENWLTASRGRLSPKVEGWSKVSSLFLLIGPFVQTTSGNALKTVTSSKSERTLMALVVVGLTVPPVQQKECYVPREIL